VPRWGRARKAEIDYTPRVTDSSEPREVETDLDTGTAADPVSEAYLLCRTPGEVRVLTLADGDSVTIGREAGADIVVADTRVSRLHARFCLREGVLTVEDLGSRNGTNVDATNLKGARAPLRAGHVVRIGPIEVAVARSPDGVVGPDPAPTDATGLEALLDSEGLVVADPSTLHALGVARRVAKTEATVLLTGETGVGKEVFASLIHRASARSAQRYVGLNCAAIPGQLLESELFGHERGAFTGADKRRIGYFEAATGGTLLLDEIGDMPLETQTKLLRVLEERTVTRLGSTESIPVDVRVLAATHQDLDAAIAAGTFRRDLYYRIAAFTLHIPPLRERKTEIAILAERFARHFSRLPTTGTREVTVLRPDAIAALLAHPFPGNVRELRNAIEFAAVMAEGGPIMAAHLPASIRADSADAASADSPVRERLDDLERKAIEDALKETDGNRTHAAIRLGMSRRGLIYKLHKYGLK
jgi:transcriptional regulator with AAA-type ATPase domain